MGKPRTPQYDVKQGEQSQQRAAELNQLYSQMQVEGPMGTASITGTGPNRRMVAELSDIGKQRQSLVEQGLSGLQNQPDATKDYYEQALALLSPDIERRADKTREQMLQMGIDPGSTAYSEATGRAERERQMAMNQLATNAMMEGQKYRGAQISNLGSLQAGIENPFANLPTQTSNAFTSQYDKLYGSQAQRAAEKSAGEQALYGALGSLGGATLGAAGSAGGFGALFSDERLKENLIPVGKLNNGLTVYLGNYNDKALELDASLDKRTQLFLIAQEVEKINPDAVLDVGGYLKLNYEEAVK